MEANSETEPLDQISKIAIHDRRKFKDKGSDDGSPPEAKATESVEEPASESQQLSDARAEAAAHLEDLQRLKAEFDNYRKRVLKDQTALAENATVGLIARLLGVLDSFELGVAAAEETRDFERMLKGVEMVFGELKEVLRTEGLQAIDAKGKDFDPNLHEAALEIPGDDSGKVVVADVLRPGYLFKDRVLRPAMVKVVQKSDKP